MPSHLVIMASFVPVVTQYVTEGLCSCGYCNSSISKSRPFIQN